MNGDRLTAVINGISAKDLQKIVPGVWGEIAPKLSEESISKVVPALSNDSLLQVLPRLDSKDLSSVVEKLDFDSVELQKLFSRLSSDQISSVIPSLSSAQVEMLIQVPDLTKFFIDYGGAPLRIYPPRVRNKIDLANKKLKQLKRIDKLEPYQVTFGYYMDSESYKVKAHSFREALLIGLRLKRKVGEPEGVIVEKEMV